MNQRRQGGQGGQGRQMQRQTPPQQQSQNQQISQAQWAAERTKSIVDAVVQQRRIIESVLPDGVGFDRFRTTLLMLLRHNPDILECTNASIVQCCIRGAYDGVNLDGVEAAAVPSNNKYKDENGHDRWRKEARYNIMVAGVRKQIMATGMVKDPPETIIVYSNEEFEEWIEDGQRQIRHRKKLADRGDMVGVYSMARLHSGNISYEVMALDDIVALKQFATQKGAVWTSKMEGEMWRKSVLRRHKKTLLGGTARPDAEEIDLFPENPANVSALPPPRARPQRSDYARLPDQQGTASGVDIGFNEADFQMEQTFRNTERMANESQQAREVDQNEQRQQENRPDDRNAAENRASGADQKTDNAGEKSTGKPKPSEQAKAAPPPIPANAQEWRDFEDGVIADIRSAPNSRDLRLFWGEIEHIIEAADPSIANRLNDAMSDRLSDLASAPPADDEAGASQGSSTSGGEE